MKKITQIFLLLVCAPAFGDEGMWTLENFPADAVKEKYGVDITDDWLTSVRSSVARLDGGCSASFVSETGLVLTNHHCATRCIARNSSAERDLEKDGFLASSTDEELSCPAFTLSVLIDATEVTEQIVAGTGQLDDAAANEAREKAMKRLVRDCEQNSPYKCEAKDLYRGGQYWLYRYKRYNDVRLVFAPESDIAAFGGDPDNFNFPRWCLDMTFLRVYEDGQPAQTPNFLEWREEGLEPGEAMFVAGRPGSTQRLLTVSDLIFLRNVTLPAVLLRYSELRGRLIQFSATSDEAYRISQTLLQSLENSLKVYRKRLDALHDDELFARKSTEEAALQQAVASNDQMADAVGTAWRDIEESNRTLLSFYDEYYFIENRGAFGGALFRHARNLLRWADESQKPNEDRLKEFTDERATRLRQVTLADRPIYAELEFLQLSFSLDKMREYLGPDSLFVKQILGDSSPEEVARRVVDGTRLADAAVRKEFWDMDPVAIRASQDTMIQLALAVDADARALRKRYEDEVVAPSDLAYERIARARFQIYGTNRYPDATFTLRVSYGAKTGWNEKNKTIRPWTTVSELFPRVTGDPPFRLPESWQDARESLDGDTRFNWVGTTDIIGGNSGSPALDADGRIVGLVFDGNIHSISGAYWYDEKLNRTVSVHPGIMIESLRKIYGADHLLKEMGLD